MCLWFIFNFIPGFYLNLWLYNMYWSNYVLLHCNNSLSVQMLFRQTELSNFILSDFDFNYRNILRINIIFEICYNLIYITSYSLIDLWFYDCMYLMKIFVTLVNKTCDIFLLINCCCFLLLYKWEMATHKRSKDGSHKYYLINPMEFSQCSYSGSI